MSLLYIIISGFGIYGAAVVPDSGVGNTWQRLTLVLHEFLSNGLIPSRLHIVISFLTHADQRVALPCELNSGHVLQTTESQRTTAIKPNRPSYLRASVRLINISKKGRSFRWKQCLNQKQCSKWPPPALTHHDRRRTTPLMQSSCHDGVIQLSPLSSYVVLEVVKISNACFVHLLLQYSSHTLVNWI